MDIDCERAPYIVGENMRRYRLASGWSQAGLGERLGGYLDGSWSRQAVSHAEKGGRAFGVSELVALTKTFDLPLSAFFLDVPDPEPEPARPSLSKAAAGRKTFVAV